MRVIGHNIIIFTMYNYLNIKLTYVRESAGRSFAKLFGFVRQRYFYDAGYGPGRCLHLYGVWSQ